MLTSSSETHGTLAPKADKQRFQLALCPQVEGALARLKMFKFYTRYTWWDGVRGWGGHQALGCGSVTDSIYCFKAQADEATRGGGK